MAITPPVTAQDHTAAWYENYISTNFSHGAKGGGVAKGGPFNGKTYLQIYQEIWAKVQADPTTYANVSPYQVFQYVAAYYVTSNANGVFQQSFEEFAKIGAAINKGVLKGANQIGQETSPPAWLGSLGGLIGSGLEGGFVALFKDLWNVIVGPLEILAGFIIIAVTLGLAFKDDLLAVAGPIAMGAML